MSREAQSCYKKMLKFEAAFNCNAPNSPAKWIIFNAPLKWNI